MSEHLKGSSACIRSITKLYLCSGFALFWAVAAVAATPKVSNRVPDASEIGYRPADKSYAEMNPPSLAWVREKDAVSYRVQWSALPDFSYATTISDLPFNTYTHNVCFASGTYYWRYGFKNAKGQQSGWSVVRQFEVGPKSIPFPLPSKAYRRQLVPAEHPRLFVRPEMIPSLQAAADGPLKEQFARLRSQADRLIGAKLTGEPRNPGTATVKTNLMLLKNWWANREQTVRACMDAETVAFVFLVTGEPKYGAEARRRLMDLAAWDPDRETNFKRNCEAAKPLLHRIARVYDWCYPALSSEDRAMVQKAVKRRIHDAWVSGEVGQGVGAINNPYGSHANRTFHKIGESGIVFLGEIPEADLWLDYALNKFYACYPAWSDADGGWHEGGAYWAGYMSKIVWWLDAMDVALKIDGFKKPFFSHVGDFAMYVAPPGSPNMGFADLSFRPPSRSWGSFLGYFIRRSALNSDDPDRMHSNAAYWQWWSQQWEMSGTDGVLGFLYDARLPATPKPRPPSDLPVSKVFNGTGIASLHSTLLDSSDDVHLLFKSSPFGSRSHGFNPQNSIQLNAYGECLLPACVYRDYYGTGFHYKWVHETVSQNAVLVNRKGQLRHGSAPGRIVHEAHGPGWDYVRGDAVEAYGGVLKRALRHVLFIKPDVIVLFDELEAAEPSTFQFMLHGLSAFKVDAENQRLGLQLPKAGLRAYFLSEEPLAMKQWDGFDPKPVRGDFPNHWHLEASTVKNRKTTETLTVLLPYKGKSAPPTSARRIEADGALAVEVMVNGEPTLAVFRKTGVDGPVKVQGLTLDGPVAVRTSGK